MAAQHANYIEHFLYFREKADAEAAAERLHRERGWLAEVMPGAGTTKWLTLATQSATGDEDMEPIWYDLTRFASEHHGEYDGWERPLDEGEFIQ